MKLAKNRLASYFRTVLLTHLEKNHLRLVAHVNDKSVQHSTNEDPNLLTQVPLAS